MPPSFSVRQTPLRVIDLQISPLLREPPATARLLLRTLAIAACLVLAAPAWGAGKEPPAPPAGGIKEARTLVQAGRFEGALGILRPLARGRTGNTNASFLIGLAAIGASQQRGVSEERRDELLDEAIAALRTMLVQRPDLVRVRLELARAFFLKGEDTLARRHFEQVLAGKPPAAVALNVNRFLNAMRARKRWSLRVGAALAPDTNIGAGSDERIIYIDGFPFRRNQEELTESGIGISVWTSGEYQYPLDDRWRLRAGGNFSRREYRGSDFDQMTVAAHLGPRRLVGKYTEASLLASVRQNWRGDEADFRDIGLRVESRRRLTRRATANARVSHHERRYEERTHLDGPVTDLSLGVGYVMTPTLRVDASFGWGRERPEFENFRHSRRWLQTGVTAVLPWGFTLGGSGTLRWTDYEGDWSFYTEGVKSRRDLTRSIRVFVHNRALTLEGFSPQVSVVQEQRTTNAQLYDYERIFGELRFVRLF